MRGALLAILAVGAVAAQDPARQTFRATTRLVEVSVVVHDRDGQPIPGLTAADFRLSEDGRPQSIDVFSVQDDRVAPPGAPVRAVPALAAAPPAAGESSGDFSNWRDGQRTGVTVILVDRVNSTDVDQKAAREQLVKFLEQIQAGDRIALYVLEQTSIRVLHDFTADASSLLRSLARYRARANGDPEGDRVVGPATGDPEVDSFLAAPEQMLQAQIVRNRAEVTAAGFEALAAHLGGIHGRKNLIWLSSGFPIVSRDERGSPITFSAQAGRAMRAISDANIAVYPVDDRRNPGYLVFSPLAPTTVGRGAQPTAPSGFPAAANSDVMFTIADATGGRAFTNTNDLTGAIRRAVNDAQLTYVLGYYPVKVNFDGKFHAIKVSVARPGVNVRARSGYFAYPTPPKVPLLDTARNPLNATGLRLSAHVAPGAAAASGARQLSVTIRVEPGAITLAKSGDTWDGALDVLIAQSVPAGTFSKTFERTVSLRFPDEARQQIMQEGFTMDRTVAVEPGAHQLHIVMRDAATGATGSLNVPIQPK